MNTTQSHMDISGQVDVASPDGVCRAVSAIFRRRYRGADFSLLSRLFRDFHALYRGDMPGFLACDTTYHDIAHVLDVSLACARLIDGYDAMSSPGGRLGASRALLGIAVALFHDSGYIRRKGDSRHGHGAEYTRTHVSRSARFLREYLPQIGLQAQVPLATKLVHFTGYEITPDRIAVSGVRDRVLGGIIGTADVIAQMADPAYLPKCRDHLYPEFVLGGMTKRHLPGGGEQTLYASALDLLEKTPAFIDATLSERLDGYFDGLYRCAAAHFGGSNLYMQALEHNRQHLARLLQQQDRRALKDARLKPPPFNQAAC